LLQFFFRSLWVVTKEHWKKPYDLIHVHSVPDFEVFAAIFAKLTGAKVILDIQGLDIAIRAFAKIHTQVPNAEFHVHHAHQLLHHRRTLEKNLLLQTQLRHQPLERLQSVAR
jgi:hypothetical protein